MFVENNHESLSEVSYFRKDRRVWTRCVRVWWISTLRDSDLFWICAGMLFPEIQPACWCLYIGEPALQLLFDKVHVNF